MRVGCRPYRGLMIHSLGPTAYAVGLHLAPLRGSRSFQAGDIRGEPTSAKDGQMWGTRLIPTFLSPVGVFEIGASAQKAEISGLAIQWLRRSDPNLRLERDPLRTHCGFTP